MPLLVAALLAAGPCTLAGDGDAALCRKVYYGTRAAALLAPRYDLATDGETVRHGLSWELSFDVPKELWARFFALGAPIDEAGANAGRAESAFLLNVGGGVAWYPGSERALTGRGLVRARFISLLFPESPAVSFAHAFVGLGGFLDREGAGPRIELRVRFGHVAWGGLVLAAGYQPHLTVDHREGDFSLGFEAPWVWWW